MNNQRNKPNNILWILMLLLLVVSCQRNDSCKDFESSISAIDDSLAKRSPATRGMIDKAMKSASDSTAYYEAAVRLARYYILSPTPDSANVWLKNTERFVSDPKTPREKALKAYVYNSEAACLHSFHKDTDKSIELYKKSYDLLMQSDKKCEAPKVCANLGDAYYYKNLLPDAASWYRRALFLTDSLRLPAKENISLFMGLALIYQQLGDDDKALMLYQKTDHHFADMTVSMQAYFLNNYGCYYYFKKDYNNSLKLFLRLRRHLEQNKMTDTFDMYLCKLNLADVYLNLRDFGKAEECLNEVEPFWKKNGDPTALYYCTTIRLGIAVGRGDDHTASEIVNGSKDTGGMMFSMRQIRNRYLRKYYESHGNWQAAYRNLTADIAENDSLEHNRTNMRAADIMSQYQQDTLRLHNSVLMEHKESEVSTARLWLVVAIASIVVLLLVVVMLVLRAHRRTLRQQMQVMQLRLENARNRISPHFVFNVLNNRIVGAEDQEADELFDLSKLIRSNLDMAGHLTVTLAEELDFVNRYVSVERKLLVNDDFVYTLDVDKSIDPKKAVGPSMAIQILVENAFVHGLMGRTDHKTLTITVRHINNEAHISVLDNGKGFDMRSYRSRRRTGLNVIRQTIAVINERNSRHIQFSLHNKTDENGDTIGCEALLIIPDGMKYPS